VGDADHDGGYDQNTLYEMKWDPYAWSIGSNAAEYAIDTDWAHNIAVLMQQYSYMLNGVNPGYDIPAFTN